MAMATRTQGQRILCAVVFVFLLLAPAPFRSVGHIATDVIASGGISAQLIDIWQAQDGLELIPGAVVNKSPGIKNTCVQPLEEWVGMRVTFIKLGESGQNPQRMTTQELTALFEILEIDFDEAHWQREQTADDADNGAIYFYRDVLKQGESTPALFTKVMVKGQTSIAQMEAIAHFAPGGFSITLDGAAVYAPCAHRQAVYGEIKKLLSYKHKAAAIKLRPLFLLACY